MRLKLDENLGTRGAALLRERAHEVATVADEDLCAASDTTLIEVCRVEQRCLVTLDLDFANPLRFRPGRYASVVVLRLAGRATAAALDEAMTTLSAALQGDSPLGRLWIVEAGRVRQYEGA